MKITPEEFELIAGYIQQTSGIRLDAKKAYLIETRLKKLLREFDCGSYSELHRKAREDRSKRTEGKIIDAISTNETLFFRDMWPFELLKQKILPEIIEKRKNGYGETLPIRIWSAGCSTGQEVYSIAIILRETLPVLREYDITLLGSDISGAAIEKAASGIYNSFETDRGLTKEKLRRYLIPEGNNRKVRDDIRKLAVFKQHNLLHDFRGLGSFDIVFCRNVSIYFSLEHQNELFSKISGVMEQGGYLITGSTESAISFCSEFELRKYSGAFFYQLKD